MTSTASDQTAGTPSLATVSEPRSSALIVDATRSVAQMLSSYVRLKVGTETESAQDFAALKQLLADDADRFYVAAIDPSLPDAAESEVIDFVVARNIPVVVLTTSVDDALRDSFMDSNVVDIAVKSDASELEYATTLVHRVYNNRFIKILIVDDSASYRHYLRELLKLHQYQTIEARDGVEALQILQDNSDVRLVIADYNMPKMNGLQLIARIRQQYARSEMAVLGISQIGDEKLPARLLKSGASDFVTKPLIVEEFYSRVTHCIETIEHIRLIEDIATRDYLTRAYNRRYLFEAGARLHENARRGNLSLVAAMIDADHFKTINDNCGHHVGDLVLKEIAATLAACLRQSDLVARFGGEEFCVLATGLDAAGAALAFERVRREISALEIDADDQSVGVTVSIGVTLETTESLETMIKAADKALYQAKSSGRDRVVIVGETAGSNEHE